MKPTLFLYCILASFCLMLVNRLFDRAQAQPRKNMQTAHCDSSVRNNVVCSAQDSTRADEQTQTVQLYGKAVFKYNGLEVNADYITFNKQTKTGVAQGHAVMTPPAAGVKCFSEKINFNYNGL